jgi:DNA/RNA endonuclease G, NUC1
MNTQILTFQFLVFCIIPAFAQIIVDKSIYKANFSNTLYVPRYVSYYLYKGGGKCDRKKENFSFNNDMPELQCAKNADYSNNTNQYQKGHLANAEDFAYDCKLEELTFRYYNCLPQTENLSKGICETKEAQIREWSKKRKVVHYMWWVFQRNENGTNSGTVLLLESSTIGQD